MPRANASGCNAAALLQPREENNGTQRSVRAFGSVAACLSHAQTARAAGRRFMGASGLPAVVVPLWRIASGAKISRRGGHVRKRGRSSSSRCMFLSGSKAFCLFRYAAAAAANTAGFAMAFTCIATPPPPRSFSAACRRPSSPSSSCSRWQMLLQLTIPTATYAFMTTIHNTSVHQPHNCLKEADELPVQNREGVGKSEKRWGNLRRLTSLFGLGGWTEIPLYFGTLLLQLTPLIIRKI